MLDVELCSMEHRTENLVSPNARDGQILEASGGLPNHSCERLIVKHQTGRENRSRGADPCLRIFYLPRNLCTSNNQQARKMRVQSLAHGNWDVDQTSSRQGTREFSFLIVLWCRLKRAEEHKYNQQAYQRYQNGESSVVGFDVLTYDVRTDIVSPGTRPAGMHCTPMGFAAGSRSRRSAAKK